MKAQGQLLSDPWYLDYASGNMTGGMNVLLSSHVELSTSGARRVSELDRIGGCLLDSHEVSDEPLAFSADDILSRLDLDAPAAQAVNDNDLAPEDTLPILPEALKGFLRDTDTRVKWEFLGPGLSKAMLWTGEDGEKLWLLKARGGTKIPRHGHSGVELTLVLKGSFTDGTTCYRAGDVEESDEDIQHDIQIDEGETCICLALTQGKLRYDNPILKVFQVFSGL